MNVYCYKIDQKSPVIIRSVRMVSVIETVKTFGQAIIDAGLDKKFPELVDAEDKLMTVSVVCENGSMYTSYDVSNLEVD